MPIPDKLEFAPLVPSENTFQVSLNGEMSIKSVRCPWEKVHWCSPYTARLLDMWAKLKRSCPTVPRLGLNWSQITPQKAGKTELRELRQAPDKSDFSFLIAATTWKQGEQICVLRRGIVVFVSWGFIIAPGPLIIRSAFQNTHNKQRGEISNAVSMVPSAVAGVHPASSLGRQVPCSSHPDSSSAKHLFF